MSEWWINGKMTDVTISQAILKLIDIKAFVDRYGNPHDKWTDAVNIGIEALRRVESGSTNNVNSRGALCDIHNGESREITRAEFYDYAAKHKLVVWSTECSDSAMNALDKLNEIKAKFDVSKEHGDAFPYALIDMVREVLSK